MKSVHRLLLLALLLLLGRPAAAQRYTELEVTEIITYLTGDETSRKMIFLQTFADGERGSALLEEASVCIGQLYSLQLKRKAREMGMDISQIDELRNARLTKNPAAIYEQLCRFAIGRKPWTSVFDMGNGLLAVQQEKGECQTGVIDVSGEVILPFEYELGQVDAKRSLMTVANSAKRYALFNYAGEQLSGFDYAYISVERGCNCYPVMDSKGREGLIDLRGNIVLPLQYSKVKCYFVGSEKRYQPVDHCFWLYDSQKRVGMADADGKIIFPCKYKGGYYDDGKTDPVLFPKKNLTYFVGVFIKDGKEYVDIYDPETWEVIRTMPKPH